VRGEPFRDAKELYGPAKKLLTPRYSTATGKKPENLKKLPAFRGYYRISNELPMGEIWRAVATISQHAVLYVNGRKVEDITPIQPRPSDSFNTGETQDKHIDLKQYLLPGKQNIFALHGEGDGKYPPVLYLSGSVVMKNGTRIDILTDECWKWSPDAPGNWFQSEFNDARWRPIGAEWSNIFHLHKEKDARATLWWHGYQRAKDSLPAYGGLIALVSPGNDKQLFFKDDKSIIIHGKIPGGMQTGTLRIKWGIERYSYHNDSFENVSDGVINTFSPKNNSQVCDLLLGRLPMGVYLLRVTLLDGDKVLEKRIPEPFVVVGPLKQKEVSGETFEQGMKLTLEHEIDFTKPEDSAYEWSEADGSNAPTWRWVVFKKSLEKPIRDPLVVERNGLRYRTTRSQRGAQFSYLIKKFKHPGDYYLCVLEYPDDADRYFGMYANSITDVMGNGATLTQKSSSSVWTGFKHPVSGKMKTTKWLLRTNPGPHSFNLMSLAKGLDAAAASLKIYHIEGALPALKLPNEKSRWIGYLYESVRANGGRGNWYQMTQFDSPAMDRSNNKVSPLYDLTLLPV